MQSLYKPLGEEEVMAARFGLLDDGIYDAVITRSEREISKASNNVMAKMQVKVFDREGGTHDIQDFLVFTPKMLWKIKHFCDASGLSGEYAAGIFTPELAAQKHVRVHIGREEGNEIPAERLHGKPEGSRYPARNKVLDYIALEDNNAAFANEPIPS